MILMSARDSWGPLFRSAANSSVPRKDQLLSIPNKGRHSPASYSYFLDNAFIPRLARGSKGAVTNWNNMNPMMMGRFSALVSARTESLKPKDENRAPLLMNSVNRVNVANR